MNYKKQLQKLPNTQKGNLNKHGESLIKYIQNTEENYATSNYIASEMLGDPDPAEIGTAIAGIGQIYNEKIDYTSNSSTRAQWMLFKIRDLPLQKLADEVLE
jgi:hypothetical protein